MAQVEKGGPPLIVAVTAPACGWAWRAGSRTTGVTTGRGCGGARRPDPGPTPNVSLAETSGQQTSAESAAPAPEPRHHCHHHHQQQQLLGRHAPAPGGDQGHGAVSHRGAPPPVTPVRLCTWLVTALSWCCASHSSPTSSSSSPATSPRLTS